MSELKKHYFKVPKNIKNMTEEELSAYADELYTKILDAFEEDKKDKNNGWIRHWKGSIHPNRCR